MARSAGTYTAPASSWNPAVNGASATFGDWNALLTDLSNALTQSIAVDGQSVVTANLPMAGFKLTGLGAASAATDSARAGDIQSGAWQYLTGVAGTNTVTANLTGLAAYAAGQTFRFIVGTTNTGAVTLNVNSVGAKAITKNGTTALVAGDLLAGAAVEVIYDGTQFQLVGPPNIPQGSISGLIQSTAGSSATMTFTAGQAVDSTNVDTLTLAAAISKTTSAWAVGSTNGGLDTGAIANSTAYYFWLIKRVDTGVVDVLISLSATAPTMPANYTLKRLIGWGRTNGSAQWISFTAREATGGGLDFQWSVPLLDINTTTLSTTRVLTTLTVPTAFATTVSMRISATNSGSSSAITVSCPDETDAAPSVTASPGCDLLALSGGNGVSTAKIVRTSTSGQVASRASAANTALYGVTIGFTWSRR